MVVVGPIALDDIHAPSGTRQGLLGGSAAYAGLAAAADATVQLVSVCGTDLEAEALAPLAAAGIELTGVEWRAGRTLRWSGTYRGETWASSVRNTDLGVVRGWTPRLPEAARDAGYAVLANTDPAVQASALDQLQPDLVVADTMDQWLRERRAAFVALLARVAVLSLNARELTLLTGERDPLLAAARALTLGPRAVIAKRGPDGAALVTRNGAFAVPAYPVAVVDPTGAGDALAGAFAGRLARTGRDDEAALHDALVAGLAAASFAVEGFGLSALAAARPAERAGRHAWLAGRAGTVSGPAL